MTVRIKASSSRTALSQILDSVSEAFDKFVLSWQTGGHDPRNNDGQHLRGFVMAFLLSCGQGVLVAVWLFMNQPHWPAAVKLILPIIWFTIVLSLMLKFIEGARLKPATLKEPQNTDQTPAASSSNQLIGIDENTNLQLATVTHELKTPLNAILGFSEILNREFSSSGQSKEQEYARLIHESGRHLLSVVNGILDLSRIQSGTYDYHPEPIAVRPLVETCCAIIRPLAQHKSIKLEWRVAEALGELRGDERACRQILLNLLSNAVKFTPIGGRVLVTARRRVEGIEIVVRDSGAGIPAGTFERLCEPFIQGDQGLCRGHDGTGIGLAVVDALTDLQDGTLQLLPEGEELAVAGLDGAAVSLTLPQWRGAAKGARKQAA